VVLTGTASRAAYGAVAEALVERMPGARRSILAGRSHTWPLTDPAEFAAVVLTALAQSGLVPVPGDRLAPAR
jgi:hypothetical protein